MNELSGLYCTINEHVGYKFVGMNCQLIISKIRFNNQIDIRIEELHFSRLL